jgi:carbohydrate-selective porin OprB
VSDAIASSAGDATTGSPQRRRRERGRISHSLRDRQLGRPAAGLAFGYLAISPAARRFSRDLVAFRRAAAPFAGSETVIEATYQAPPTDYLTVQPDAQLVLNPNAGMPGAAGVVPHSPDLVIGLRVTIRL